MSFHLYDINELYSNADGSVQFIELVVGNFNGESLWQGKTITASEGNGTSTGYGYGEPGPVTATHSFAFPSNLPSTATANTSVLIGTQGFADLGIVTPNFIVPAGFLFLSGGVLNFAGADSVSYGALPVDGIHALNRSGASVINSPKNFAGDSGTIPGNPVVGTNGADSLTGTAASDYMVAKLGNDTLSGGDGFDTLYGSAGDDFIVGNRDDDMIFGGDGADVLRGNRGDDFLQGNKNRDLLVGGGGNDELRGGNATDILRGGGGDDVLIGGRGADTLNGGPDDDTLWGKEGNDVFVFNQLGDGVYSGRDTIQDFIPGEDVIQVAAFVNDTTIEAVTDILARVAPDGAGGSVIDLGGGNVIELPGVSPASLDADDFVIV